MPHMVIYRAPDGSPAYHQAEALEDAVRFVEHLRNQEQVGDARIFRMQEVAIEFRAYYRVEVAPDGEPVVQPAQPAQSAEAGAPVAEAPVVAAEAAAQPVPAGSSNGTGGRLFGKT
jgi:hypothetical protein